MQTYEVFSQVSLTLVFKASFIMLLMGLHIHLFMVRSEAVPLLFPRPKRSEFELLVNDIMHHEQFVKLKDFHHHTTSIYDHVMRVAFLSYGVSRLLRLNYHASARGGLLHDFFLYDWRTRKTNDVHRSLHGHQHPHIALENARKHFSVNEVEADIIVKHMYPKTRSLPRYKESFLVSLMDKVATLYEYTCHAFRCVTA